MGNRKIYEQIQYDHEYCTKVCDNQVQGPLVLRLSHSEPHHHHALMGSQKSKNTNKYRPDILQCMEKNRTPSRVSLSGKIRACMHAKLLTICHNHCLFTAWAHTASVGRQSALTVWHNVVNSELRLTISIYAMVENTYLPYFMHLNKRVHRNQGYELCTKEKLIVFW